MDLVNLDKKKELDVSIWSKYKKICDESKRLRIAFYKMDRFEFYKRAKTAFAIVAIVKTAFNGNIILKKGVVTDPEVSK